MYLLAITAAKSDTEILQTNIHNTSSNTKEEKEHVLPLVGARFLLQHPSSGTPCHWTSSHHPL